MSDAQKVRDALKGMDPKNDNHWTMSGEAKLETVKFLSGGVTVTREEFNAIAPGFNREAMEKYVAAISEAANGGQITTTESEPVKPEQQTVADGSTDREDEIKALSEEIDNANEEINECQRVQAEALKRLNAAEIRRQRASTALSKIQPPVKEMVNIQAYLESNKKVLARRGQARRVISESGLDLGAVQQALSPSALDQALMGRKRRR